MEVFLKINMTFANNIKEFPVYILSVIRSNKTVHMPSWMRNPEKLIPKICPWGQNLTYPGHNTRNYWAYRTAYSTQIIGVWDNRYNWLPVLQIDIFTKQQLPSCLDFTFYLNVIWSAIYLQIQRSWIYRSITTYTSRNTFTQGQHDPREKLHRLLANPIYSASQRKQRQSIPQSFLFLWRNVRSGWCSFSVFLPLFYLRFDLTRRRQQTSVPKSPR